VPPGPPRDAAVARGRADQLARDAFITRVNGANPGMSSCGGTYEIDGIPKQRGCPEYRS